MSIDLKTRLGPAFPVADLSKTQFPGMSYRAYVAAAVLAASAANPGDNEMPDEKRAKWAVKCADALIAELQKGGVA